MEAALPKGRTPNICYCFVAKHSIVAIYAFFERILWSFKQKSSCFDELSMKASLVSESFQQKFEATLQMPYCKASQSDQLV